MATAVIALGAVSCGAGDTSVAVPSRPEGTGPLARDVVRTDLDTSAAAAGAPENDPDYLSMSEKASPDSVKSCAVVFKGFGTDAAPVDLDRFEATVHELRKRDWKQAGKPDQRKNKRGEVFNSKVILEQRGWRIVAEYMDPPKGGTVGLVAFDNACMKAHGSEAGPVG
ncbi:hypothetical protein DRB96_37605 [Streptomyces sp. ICC1]|nr:hypothetical protein DRB89_37270 [Streptomyces sp. ICC4]AWZ16938.1 hypothetical protein DRB96_37605 [Streptomyces sp. ICC1]